MPAARTGADGPGAAGRRGALEAAAGTHRRSGLVLACPLESSGAGRERACASRFLPAMMRRLPARPIHEKDPVMSRNHGIVAFSMLAIVTACGGSATFDPSGRGSSTRIVNGVPTGSSFGNVGAVMFDFNSDGLDADDWFCTGS